MEVLFLLILGLVQGLTEFLPVSSSGHLVLLSRYFGINDSLFVSIILHLATLLSVVVALRKEIFALVRHPFSQDAMKIYIATIPTCIIVLVLLPFINASFEGSLLPICFLITAGLLFYSSRKSQKKCSRELSNKQALIMGIAQGFATFPGISRSGATISAGLISGADKSKAAKFSFLMSVPIIILSLVMEIGKICICHETISVNMVGLVLAFLVAFVSGLLSIKLMLKITEKANFKWFSLYLIVISILSFIF